MFDTLPPLPKERQRERKKGTVSKYKISTLGPMWSNERVKRNLWRSDKRNLGYLSPSNKILTILCFITTGYKYLLHCQTKFPDKKFVGFFWLVLLPGIRQPERRYRIYSTESCSVSIGNMWVELNTFRNWHIVLVRIHSCSRSGIVKQLCLRCATVWPPEQRDRII